MKIGNSYISDNKPPFIIAEISANHNGSLAEAKNIIFSAKQNGANAVKIQTYTADTMTIDSDKSDFKIKHGLWKGSNLFELYKKAETPFKWQKVLFEYANSIGITIFSTPFDESAVNLLESLNTPAYKIASFEITDIPLIEYVALKGKPIILSTGIANKEDIELALDACRRMGNKNIALLKCTSSYPAPIEEANLVMINDLAERYNVISGLSDHTLGSTAPVVATVLGAKIIEKHFIIDRSIGGPDASFSMNEKEFTLMVNAVRDAEKSIGKINYRLTEKQLKGRDFSRSLYIVSDLKKGETLNESNLKSIRPGFGMHPKYLKEILGKEFKNDLERGTALKWDYIKDA